MKLGNKEISALTDQELIAAYNNCGQVEKQRDEASKHEKFKKMEFPPPNPAYIKLKEAIVEEMNKRKLLK